MVARVVSTLGEAPSTRVAEASILVGVSPSVGLAMLAGAWGKEAAEEAKASTEVVVIKVLDIVDLAVILFKGNQVGQPEAGIFQVLEMRIGGGGGQRNYNNNYYINSRAGYGNNQQRWVSQNNVGRGGAFQSRYRGNNDGAAARGPIDADLLHQTVQAVVAAVTAAQKAPEANNTSGPNGVAGVLDPKVATVNPKSAVQQSNKDVEPQVVQGNAREIEGSGIAKKKKDDKEVCFRCKTPGHFIDDCTTPYCDICESIHHISSACHLLQAPKPTAILHGYANDALMFFEMPCGAFKAKVENPKLVKVSVEGEVMTIPEIIEHMKRIVPSEKFNWEVYHYKDNIYRVKLPSKQEVQRLKNFGFIKTLDVDMPFTRKNKLLRIKIGCLDRNLIPGDSDVFIRRGFYKLRFEVETGHVAQEVNMAEANDDKDGGGDSNNGLGNGDGHNDMEMDTRGAEEEGSANNNGQDENGAKNGVEGMQEQCEQVEEINIGALKVPLSPLDFGSGRSASGLPRDRMHVALEAVLSADSSYSRPAAAESVGQQRGAVPTTARPLAVQALQSAAVSPDACPLLANDEQRSEQALQIAADSCVAVSPLANEMRRVGLAGDRRGRGVADMVGSDAVAHQGARQLFSTILTQKIQATAVSDEDNIIGDRANHWAADEPMMRSAGNLLGRSSVHGNAGSLEPVVQQLDHAMGSSLGQKKGEIPTVEFQGTMRDASSMNIAGGSFIPSDNSSNNDIYTTSISLVDNDYVSHCPSREEVIAFGGIPKPTIGVRSSTRLGRQPNADMPQMEKAMKKAQLWDESFSSGKSVKGLKMVEEERILTILEKNSEMETMEDGQETLVLSKVSTLCEDLIDDDDIPLDLDDHLEHLKPVVKEVLVIL
ncbi:hypothetical protein QYE76_050001 [Lolium multiflorum]|uniref:CCHC-type domain-containing protein n=1 Tax=Lolium multiflorum TaxID=4521 RepID=A0AAD8SP32_LOLMU|nr:hypothetical protein QYE76_050001 [Lolium multiflorum]